MKYAVLFIVAVLFSCSQKDENSSVASSPNDDPHTSQKIRSTHKTVSSAADTAKAECYQTFDEFTMSGKGEVTYYPFVYVKKWNDSILVFSSDKNDSARLYVKQDSNIWYSHMEYDMWKKRDYVPSKDGMPRPPRTYDRYFYNDTILELESRWLRGQRKQCLYIKSRSNLCVINNIDNVNNNISELRGKVRNTLLSKDAKVQKYILKEINDTYYYEGDNTVDGFSYDKKAYGLWGIQPGVNEVVLYEGIDIREYSDHLEGFQQNNKDHIYDVVDEMPKYPSGFEGLQDYIRKKRNKPLLINGDKPYRVVIEVVIEKDGRITNARIRKSVDSLHDNDALRIVREMPKWIPAKQNGKTVRCKMPIPISYNISF